MRVFTEQAKGDASRLAKSLVSAKLLTPYQSKALLQGRGKGLAVGPYIVLEKRGQGGMGVVFRAKRRDGGPEVALKVLLPSFSRDREAVLRFRREFEIAARLGHPNVVSALDASEDRGVQYLTMEYVDGRDLDAAVRDVGPLPVKMSIHCVIQAAHGLAAAHAQDIIHRDVKPANLMLTPSGLVRVLDLGLARVIEAANPLGKASGAALTQSGAYMGTVDFIAPEQADDSKRATHKADIYSLGCTLYFLLTGRPPFEGDTLLKRLMAHQQRPAPSLYAAREDIPAALEAAYQAMMAKRPGDRPRSMDEVAELLEACRASADEAKAADAGMRSFAETVMKRASPRKRDRSPDASIFARRQESDGLVFDHGLNLEDLVMDYREEAKIVELTEEQLPPMMPRISAPRRRSRRPRASRPLMGLLAAVALLGVGYAYFPRPEPVIAPSAQPIPQPKFVDTLGIKIVTIEPGEFWMGGTTEELEDYLKDSKEDDRDRIRNIMKRHRVRLTKLQGMSAHEITVGQFRQFSRDSGFKTRLERRNRDSSEVAEKYATWESNQLGQTDNHPVTFVDWNDAMEFCAWLSRKDGRSYRLPTEAEWEYCCRAGAPNTMVNGKRAEDFKLIANMGDAAAKRSMPDLLALEHDDGYALTSPVAHFAPNAWGLYDMYGNLWEWCLDNYDESYYSDSPPVDPEGPLSGKERGMRGSSWFDANATPWVRHKFRPDRAVATIGFRVVRVAP